MGEEAAVPAEELLAEVLLAHRVGCPVLVFDAGQEAVSPRLDPFLVDTERCGEDGCLVDEDAGDADGTVNTETLEGRQHCHRSHGEHNYVGDGGDLEEEEDGNIEIYCIEGSYRDGNSCLLHCHRHDLRVRHGLTLLTVDNVVMTLDDDEHIVDPNPHEQEGDDGVHRTEDEPQT